MLLDIIILLSTSYVLLFGNEQLQKAYAGACLAMIVIGLLILIIMGVSSYD